MQIGYVYSDIRGETDRLLADVAARLMAEGVAVAGAVQHNIACDDSHHCDMDVKVLPDGPVVRISQNLGAASSGCRLDAGALETMREAEAAGSGTDDDDREVGIGGGIGHDFSFPAHGHAGRVSGLWTKEERRRTQGPDEGSAKS